MSFGVERAESFDGLRCLVLGGGGFIGINLCRALAAAGARVTSFGRSCGFPGAIEARIVQVVGELSDRHALAHAIRDQEVVFHLVGETVPGSAHPAPVEELLQLVLPTLGMFELARAARVRKIIFVSSGGAVYGPSKVVPLAETARTQPISSYGIVKLLMEKYFAIEGRQHGTKFQIFRVANAYGPFQSAFKRNQGAVAAFIARALERRPLEIWGTGAVVRDFVHVDDVVRALMAGLRYGGPHRIMNVGTGEGRSINQVVDDLESLIGPIERLQRPGRDVDVDVNVLDIGLIGREMAWRPRVSWTEGLRDTIAWMRHRS